MIRPTFPRSILFAMAGVLPGAASAQASLGAEAAAGSPIYGALRIGGGETFAAGLRSVSPRVDRVSGQDRASEHAVASVAVGVRPRSVPLRFELEASWRGDARHRVYAVGTCTVALCGQSFNFSGNQRASIDAKTLLANAFVDRPLARGYALFAGLGGGVAFLRSSALQQFGIVQAPQAGVQTGAIWPSRSDARFAFSVTGGVSKRIGDRLTLELGGRYVDLGRYDTGYNGNLFRDERFSARLRSAEGFLGARFGL